MKRCSTCGREYAVEVRFCGEDGTRLDASAPAVDTDIAAAADVSTFDALARTTRLSQGERVAMDALWGAVYCLPSWLFMIRGDNMIPIACPIEGRMSVMAFTDQPAARRFFAHQRYGPGDDISIMLLEVEPASEMLLSLRARGAEFLQFNYPGEGFYMPLANLPAVYHYFNGRELPTASTPAVSGS